jgi:hypothetical protein
MHSYLFLNFCWTHWYSSLMLDSDWHTTWEAIAINTDQLNYLKGSNHNFRHIFLFSIFRHVWQSWIQGNRWALRRESCEFSRFCESSRLSEFSRLLKWLSKYQFILLSILNQLTLHVPQRAQPFLVSVDSLVCVFLAQSSGGLWRNIPWISHFQDC